MSAVFRAGCPVICGLCRAASTGSATASPGDDAAGSDDLGPIDVALEAVLTGCISEPAACAARKESECGIAFGGTGGGAPNATVRSMCPRLCKSCLHASHRLPSKPATQYSCSADASCKICGLSGECQRCRNSAYLLAGTCAVSPRSCLAKGLLPVGDTAYGRACIPSGGFCELSAQHSCRSPKALGDCTKSKVTSSAIACVECAPSSWLVAGVCKRELFCGSGNVYAGTSNKCTCNVPADDGGVSSRCKRCNARQQLPKIPGHFVAGAKGTFVECTLCKAPYVMHNGRCVEPSVCPPSMTQHRVGSMGGRCEQPFTCTGRVRQGGERPGKACRCQHDSLCRACEWAAGSAEQKCTECKRRTLLRNGSCISTIECLGLGLLPVFGKGPRGGICGKASPPPFNPGR